MNQPPQKNLRSSLLNFLTDLPNIQLANERQALIDFTGLGNFKKQINWHGSSFVFCSCLLNLLSHAGQQILISFLTALEESPWVGVDRRSYIRELQEQVTNLTPDEWHTKLLQDSDRFESDESINKKIIESYTFIPDRIFIQYLNPEMLLLYGAVKRYTQPDLYRIALHLTKYALLISQDSLVLPASYLFEVPFMESLTRTLNPLITNGLIYFASPTANLEEYVIKKRSEYPDHPTLFPGYTRGSNEFSKKTIRRLMWIPRIHRSSFNDIATTWREELYKEEGLWHQVLRQARQRQGYIPDSIETAIDSVPDRLGERAFIARFAEELLPVDWDLASRSQINMLIGRAYLESYLEEFSAMILNDTPLGHLDCNLPPTNSRGQLQKISFRRIAATLRGIGLKPFIESLLSWTDLVVLRDDFSFRWLIEQVIKDLINPSHPLQMAILKSGYKMEDSRIYLGGRHPLDKAKDLMMRFFQTVEPALPSSPPIHMIESAEPYILTSHSRAKKKPPRKQLTLFS